VGSYFALAAQAAGYKVVALSDSRGGIYNPEGLDPQKVLEYKEKNHSLAGFPGASAITNDALLLLPVDVLAPAALENVITDKNANVIHAKYIIEMANGPVTPEADAVLWKKKILSVPDVLANAGGVTVSYFEWVQNLYGYYWSKEEVFAKLEPLIIKAFDQMWATYLDKKVNLRMATYVGAVKRVVDAVILRGV
jgi:glutamate dehydrogenase/leucine dehydrogenase